MSILYEYFTPGSGSAYDSAKGTNKFQTFFAESSHDVSLINLRLARSSVYTETLYGVYIYSVDGDSLPDTELVQMGSFYVSDLSTSYGNYQFDDDTYSLTLGVEYAIVLATETETTQSRFSWYTNTGNNYANGVSGWGNYTSGWVMGDAENDKWFKVYGPDAPPEDGPPGKPTNPTPSNTEVGITLDQSPLTWDASENYDADTYAIYFREQGGDWGLAGEAQAGVSYALGFGSLDYNITYEWRVDATNSEGTTTGDTWSFDTIEFKTIQATSGGVGGGGGAGEESSPTGENNMMTLRRLVAVAADKFWYEDI